jgi:hypothetical protein
MSSPIHDELVQPSQPFSPLIAALDFPIHGQAWAKRRFSKAPYACRDQVGRDGNKLVSGLNIHHVYVLQTLNDQSLQNTSSIGFDV